MREPVECGSKKCPHCHVVSRDERGRVERVTDKVRSLTADDLRWWFREAESRLGARSTFGAFVDLAMSGIQGGGRSNGVERSWTDGKRRAAARETCIRRRIAHASMETITVLSAAYGPHALAHRAERVTGLAEARRDLDEMFGELLPVVLLTEAAKPLFEPEAVRPPPPSETHGRVRCGGTVREERRKEFAEGAGSVVVERPQAEMEFDAVLRLDGPVETLHAVETDESFFARVASGDSATARGEVHLRRWKGYGDGKGVLARLAELTHSALRAGSATDKSKLTAEQIATDSANEKLVDRMIEQAKALRDRAHEAIGMSAVHLAAKAPKEKRTRRTVQRSRKIRGCRAA